jgi:septum formation protein
MEWILASQSPRRKELFGELVENFTVLPAKGEERAPKGVTPSKLVETLAAQKAREIAALPQAKDCGVLGSDTVVALDGEILGKPKDTADAKRMLTALSGRAHQVYTGICFSIPDGNGGRREWIDAACTNVYFNRLSEREIDEYIATGSPMDKAGAYGIQDGGLVERIEGSFSNVVGLPVELCKETLKKIKTDRAGMR